MTDWLPRLRLLEKLDALDRRPDGNELRFERAVLLTQLGRKEEAKAIYLDLLHTMPGHFGTLNNLGVLLADMGYRRAACTAYAEAVKHHPDNPVGRINLGNALRKNQEFDEARLHFEAALRVAPDHPDAHQGMAQVLLEFGEEEAARVHRDKGYRGRSILSIPYRGEATPIHLLILASAAGGSVPIREHVDDRVFSTSVLFVEYAEASQPLPQHQLIFNAVGDADLGPEGSEAAIAVLARTNAPVINQPAAVLATGRAANAGRFANIDGVVTPKMVILPREALAEGAAVLAAEGIALPCLLRSPGFHTGRHFVLVERAEDLPAAVAALPGSHLAAIEYLDARSADGKIRKYRVMMIDRQLYPAHAAVSRDWKVHYFSADMAENAAHRAEDERFLNAMPEVLGPRLMAALGKICESLGLDYGGIDFSVNAAGELLLFEANATMVIHAPDADPVWDFRRAPVQRILDAIGRLLMSRVGGGLTAARRAYDNGDFAGCLALSQSLPAEAPVLYLQGVAKFRLGQTAAAMDALDAALALAPSNLALRFDRAQLAIEMGQADRAIQILAEGGRFHPGNPQLALRLGAALSAAGRHGEACQVLAAGIRTAPDDVELRLLMAGECLADLRPDEALAQLTVADGLTPGQAAIHSDLGLVHQARGDLAAAEASYGRAVALKPDDVQAHVNLATALLIQGKWAEGFGEHEWRLRLPNMRQPRHRLPRWTGESLVGRRLLVTVEQGYGDVIQFARFLPRLAAFGGEVLLECPPALERLFAGMARLVAPDQEAPPADLWVPLLSLPLVLGVDRVETPPYVTVPLAVQVAFPPGEGRKVGLVWSARPGQGDVYTRRSLNRRSCPLEQLAPLLAVEGVSFTSLQIDGEAHPAIHNLAPQLVDFAATAAVIAQLDLVITVDTAVAHLAGAMGKPLWVLLGPGQGDYRWGRPGERSPWYPQAELFRADEGGWAPVIRRVAERLSGAV